MPTVLIVTVAGALMVTVPDGFVVGVGNGLTVTVMLFDEPRHPFALETVQLNVPLAETLIVWVVALLLHKYEAYPAPASNVTLPP